MHKILTMTSPDAPLPALSESEQSALREVLDQPFYFLGSGGQCYAFLSEDKQTVLKFFKNHHIRFWKFLNRILLPFGLDHYRQNFLEKYQHQSPALFESCQIAYSEFRERTGLIYLHLNKTNYFKKKLTIVDNLGIVHQIDLDSIDFALQKKMEFSHPKLKQLIRQKDTAACKECIDSYLDLIVERCQKGISDRDPNFKTNFGFIGNQAFEIDLGSYSKDPSLQRQENFKKELLRNTQKFNRWLKRMDPDLSLYLNEQIELIFSLSYPVRQ